MLFKKVYRKFLGIWRMARKLGYPHTFFNAIIGPLFGPPFALKIMRSKYLNQRFEL